MWTTYTYIFTHEPYGKYASSVHAGGRSCYDCLCKSQIESKHLNTGRDQKCIPSLFQLFSTQLPSPLNPLSRSLHCWHTLARQWVPKSVIKIHNSSIKTEWKKLQWLALLFLPVVDIHLFKRRCVFLQATEEVFCISEPHWSFWILLVSFKTFIWRKKLIRLQLMANWLEITDSNFQKTPMGISKS